MIPYHQMTLADVFTETQELFESDKPEFLKLLESSMVLIKNLLSKWLKALKTLGL